MVFIARKAKQNPVVVYQVSDEEIISQNDVEYAKVDSESLKVDLCFPKYSKVSSIPAILFFHGGYWREDYGTKYGRKERYKLECQRAAKYGYLGVAVNYRLTPSNSFPAQILDAQAVVRWVRANGWKKAYDPGYSVDKNKITAWGESAGGYLALMLGSTDTSTFLYGESLPQGLDTHSSESSRVNLVIDEFGEVNLNNPIYNTSGAHYCPLSQDSFSRFFGSSRYIGCSCAWAENPNVSYTTTYDGKRVSSTCPLISQQEKGLLTQASPLTYVNKTSAPVLAIQGVNDDLVVPGESQALVDRYRSMGIENKLLYFNGSHGEPGRDNLGSASGPEMERVLSETFRFIDMHHEGRVEWFIQSLDDKNGVAGWWRQCPVNKDGSIGWSKCADWKSATVASPLDSVGARAFFVYENRGEQVLSQSIYGKSGKDAWLRTCPISNTDGILWNLCKTWSYFDISGTRGKGNERYGAMTMFVYNDGQSITSTLKPPYVASQNMEFTSIFGTPRLAQRLFDINSVDEYWRTCPIDMTVGILWNQCSEWSYLPLSAYKSRNSNTLGIQNVSSVLETPMNIQDGRQHFMEILVAGAHQFDGRYYTVTEGKTAWIRDCYSPSTTQSSPWNKSCNAWYSADMSNSRKTGSDERYGGYDGFVFKMRQNFIPK